MSWKPNQTPSWWKISFLAWQTSSWLKESAFRPNHLISYLNNSAYAGIIFVHTLCHICTCWKHICKCTCIYANTFVQYRARIQSVCRRDRPSVAYLTPCMRNVSLSHRHHHHYHHQHGVPPTLVLWLITIIIIIICNHWHKLDSLRDKYLPNWVLLWNSRLWLFFPHDELIHINTNANACKR